MSSASRRGWAPSLSPSPLCGSPVPKSSLTALGQSSQSPDNYWCLLYVACYPKLIAEFKVSKQPRLSALLLETNVPSKSDWRVLSNVNYHGT
ncbi:hypothetical protein IAQ61_008337 [Plenodomus lingam]|uniref:uncharacterized protein n=1 Tax=Leptosphaeria maculans TaxID=5022 RepID=UPI00333014E2|nr:hypothetical protein IAQ61_008337 [Plenodomus lingam]